MNQDEAVLRMLAGAKFGPNAKLILPSGRELNGEQAAEMVKQPELTLSTDELRRRHEDRWLAEQREIARTPACPCDHPPGWHFSGREALAIVLILLVIIGAAMLP